MAVVGLIPARGGSKGIPKKSIAPCAGRPLLAYTAEAALSSTRLDRVLISTDDEEIASVARRCGVDAPFLRPKALAADDTPMLDVMRHAIDWLVAKNGIAIDALVLLQPTSPLRTAAHIDQSVDLFFRNEATSVVSVVEVPHQFNPVSVMAMEDGFLRPYLKGTPMITRRQDKPKVYARNGPAVLVAAPETLLSGSLYGERCVPYVMSPRDSVDVDDPMDLEWVEWLLERRGR